jgi:hypothetical protein
MKSLEFSRYAVTIGAAAFFAGCSGSQQIGPAPSPQLQGDVASTPLPGGAVSHRASGPPPHYPQSGQPLLYVGSDNASPSAVDIFPLTGPNQGQIGSITNGVHGPWGLSIDANNALYIANANYGTVTVYPYGSTSPSMTYSHLGLALYALADSTGHVFVSGYNRHHVGHVLEFNAGSNDVIAHQHLGTEADGMAEDGQGNLYVAYRGSGKFRRSSIAEFAPGLKNKRHLVMAIEEPQGLFVDRAGNIVVVESVADRMDVFPPGATTPSVTVTISGIGNLAELAMQNSETTLWVSSEGGYVYSMPYPLTSSTVPTEYETISRESNGVAVSP